MKHDVLRSVGHNLAASLASGIGLLIGLYNVDVFGEAARTEDGCITVDFLAGTTSERASASLQEAVKLYRAAFPALCARHDISSAIFSVLRTTNLGDSGQAHQFGRRQWAHQSTIPSARPRLTIGVLASLRDGESKPARALQLADSPLVKSACALFYAMGVR